MVLYSIGSYEVHCCNYLIVKEKRKYLKSSIWLEAQPGLIYFKHLSGGGGGGLIETGGLFYLAKTMVLVLHKELQCKVEKLMYKE